MRVLYIDDDAMNRVVLRDMLEVVGVTMAEAADGATGLAALTGGGFDIALVDLRMPGIDGFEVMRRVRSGDAGDRSLPMIVVTADLSAGLVERCRRSGADEVLFKPVAMDALFDAVGRALMARDRPLG